MSGALGLLGRSAAIHHRRVLLDSAGSPCASTYSPLALDTRAPGVAGICLPLARSGPIPPLLAIQGLIATAGAPRTGAQVTAHAEAAAQHRC
jgi:hypothetical protein